MSSNPAYRKNIAPVGETVVALPRDKAHRDSEVLRLWEAKWTARKIAEFLDIKPYIVNNVVHKNGRTRNPRGPRGAIVVSLEEAPIEAWQQALVPNIKKEAAAFGMKDALEKAFVFACLLRLKKYGSLTSFVEWVCRVTGYPADEVEAFVERGVSGYLIVDGQPNDDAFRRAENDEEGGDVALALMVGVLHGQFERTFDDRYSIAGLPLAADMTRWEDDGGSSLHGACATDPAISAKVRA